MYFNYGSSKIVGTRERESEMERPSKLSNITKYRIWHLIGISSLLRCLLEKKALSMYVPIVGWLVDAEYQLS